MAPSHSEIIEGSLPTASKWPPLHEHAMFSSPGGGEDEPAEREFPKRWQAGETEQALLWEWNVGNPSGNSRTREVFEN